MSLRVRLYDPANGKAVRVSDFGELITTPAGYDDIVSKDITAAGTASNFYAPVSSSQFVITAIRVKATQSVSNTVDCVVEVYEADSPTSTTVDRALFTEYVVRGEAATITGRILVAGDKWVNVKVSDPTVIVSILGYYIGVR